jgi:hypothetical protein
LEEETLSSGSRCRLVSAVRRRLALELTDEMGLSLAETARTTGRFDLSDVENRP